MATKEELEKEVADLKRQLNDRGSRSTSGSMQDASSQVVDSMARAMRGATQATAEMIRLGADAVSSAASGFSSRNRDDSGKKSARDLSMDVPRDVADTVPDLVRDLVDIPAEAAKKFADAFSEGD